MAGNPPGGWGSPPQGQPPQGGYPPYPQQQQGYPQQGYPQQPQAQQAWGAPPPNAPPPGMNPYAAPLAQGSAMGPMYAAQSESSRAQWAIGLAIASWVLCGLLASVPALFMARAELSAIERGESSPGSKGLAQAAFWIAAANVGLTVLGILSVLVLFLFVR